MQRRLLAESDLTLTTAMEFAQGMETADSNTRAMKGTEPAIKNIKKKTAKAANPARTCYRCGKTNHSADDCRFKEADCHQCGKKGHIAPACRSKDHQKTNSSPWKGKKKYRTHHVEHEKTDTTDSENETFHVFKLAEPSSSPIHVTVKIEDEPLKMEVDTGAAVSIISEATRKAKFSHLKLRKSNIVLKTYTDQPMQVTGQLHVHVAYEGQVAPLVLVVVAGKGPQSLWTKLAKVPPA